MTDDHGKTKPASSTADPGRPDPNIKPPTYDIVTEGADPDKTVFRVADKPPRNKR
jgi:hypothetical protein